MNEALSVPRVLVVEDEFMISAMMADALTAHGCEVHVAANAKDALEHLTCGSPCDVLFTDINLPGGVDGATLARMARGLRPELPVVYASGMVKAIDQLNAVDGAAFVAKPYDPDKVCALLQQLAARSH